MCAYYTLLSYIVICAWEHAFLTLDCVTLARAVAHRAVFLPHVYLLGVARFVRVCVLVLVKRNQFAKTCACVCLPQQSTQ